jgi:hypothetical protein
VKGTVRVSDDGRALTVRVPISLRRRGGRKLVITPDGYRPWAPPRAHVDSALVKALARAFRWRKLLETGVYATVDEIAAAEKINDSYVSRVLRLTLLAPDVVETILNGRQAAALQLDAFLRPIPVEWELQRRRFAAERLSERRI